MKVQSTADKRFEEQETGHWGWNRVGGHGWKYERSCWNGQYWFSTQVPWVPFIILCLLPQCAFASRSQNLWPFTEDCPGATGGHFAHVKRDRSIWEIYSPHPPSTPWGQSSLTNWQRRIWKASCLASSQENPGIQLTLKSFPRNSGDQIDPAVWWTLPEITLILGSPPHFLLILSLFYVPLLLTYP